MSKWQASDFKTCGGCRELVHKTHVTCPHCNAWLDSDYVPHTVNITPKTNISEYDPETNNLVPVKTGRRWQYDGYVFDSKPELARYKDCLRLLHQAGTIQDLIIHPKDVLMVGIRPDKNIFRDKPKKIQDITYSADYSYTYQGITIIEDVKGTYKSGKKKGKPIITPASRLRHRMLQILRPDVVFDIVCDYEVNTLRWIEKIKDNAA